MTNAFDPARSLHIVNGAAMSPFDQVQKVPSPPCPRCGAPMSFSRLEPHPTQDDAADEVTFQCACGEVLTRREPR